MKKQNDSWSMLVIMILLVTFMLILLDDTDAKPKEYVGTVYVVTGTINEKRMLGGRIKVAEEKVPGDLMLMPMGDGVLMPITGPPRTKELKTSDKYFLTVDGKEYWCTKDIWLSVEKGQNVRMTYTDEHQITNLDLYDDKT